MTTSNPDMALPRPRIAPSSSQLFPPDAPSRSAALVLLSLTPQPLHRAYQPCRPTGRAASAPTHIKPCRDFRPASEAPFKVHARPTLTTALQSPATPSSPHVPPRLHSLPAPSPSRPPQRQLRFILQQAVVHRNHQRRHAVRPASAATATSALSITAVRRHPRHRRRRAAFPAVPPRLHPRLRRRLHAAVTLPPMRVTRV